MRRTLATLALCALLAGCATTHGLTPITAPYAGVVTLKITGSGLANISVFSGGGISHHNGIELPYTARPTVNGTLSVGIEAEIAVGNPSTSISCEIEVPGRAPVKNSSTGQYATVNCASAL